MRQWAFTVFAVCLSGGMINLISSGGKSEKHIRFVCGLACLLAVIAPLKSLVSVFENYEYSQTAEDISMPDENELIKVQTHAQISSYIVTVLKEKGIKPTDISINITVTDESLTVESITVWVEESDVHTARLVLKDIGEVKTYGEG